MDIQEAYGYCIYDMSGAFQSIEEVNSFCPQANNWEMECRHSWVSGKIHDTENYSTEFLLKACGENPDCTFELIDSESRQADDILVQLETCKKHVRKHLRDCVGHAMQRWYKARPNEAEVTKVMSKVAPVPDRVAEYVAASVSCFKVGSCEGEKYLSRLCKQKVAFFDKDPKKCPDTRDNKIKGQFSPSDLAPDPSKHGKHRQQKPKGQVNPAKGKTRQR